MVSTHHVTICFYVYKQCIISYSFYFSSVSTDKWIILLPHNRSVPVHRSHHSVPELHSADTVTGSEDDGRVTGLPEKAAPDMIKNFIKCISNPNLLSPTVYLSPEIIEYQEKTVIHVHVPPSAEVHSYKKVIYDRVDDADVKVTSTGQIAQMYIRKQGIFTEKKVYPYAG